MQWCVFVISQYSSDESSMVSDCYKMLINSIKNTKSPDILFYVLKYTNETDATMFYAYEYVSDTELRKEIPKKPVVTTNFYQSPDVITELFTAFEQAKNADKYFLLTHGHGAGFGLFADGVMTSKAAHAVAQVSFTRSREQKKRLISTINNYILIHNRLFSCGILPVTTPQKRIDAFAEAPAFKEMAFTSEEKGVLKDAAEDDFRVVHIDFIADAIRKGLDGRKIDFMYTMNCFMQMYDSGYALRDVVELYMGAENFQYFPGPDYEKLFSTLSSMPADYPADLRAIAKNIIDNYQPKYEQPDIIEKIERWNNDGDEAGVVADLANVCLSASKPYRYVDLRNMLNDVGAYLKGRKSLYPVISSVIRQCSTVTILFYGIIDIVHFCELLQQDKAADEDLRHRLHEVIASLRQVNNIIALVRPTPNLFKVTRITPAVTAPTISPHGLSFFMPQQKGPGSYNPQLQYIMDNFYKLQLNDVDKPGSPTSSWVQFVCDFFG